MTARLLFLALVCAFGLVRAGEENKLPESGREVLELKPFDELFQTFLTEHKLPGVSVAVTRNGKLIYSRGFGYADLAVKKPVQPESLFRIASISKPITAVAVLQLVEAGKIKLEDKVFARLGLEPGPHGDARLKDITVLEVLQHSGGWDRDKSFDPMFRSVKICQTLKVPPPAKANDIITYMLDQPLDFEPGTNYAYSNFGYCVLGRLIEKVSGQKYEEYVQEHVLKPLGTAHMRVGKSALEDAWPNEVFYHTSEKEQARSVLGNPKPEKVPAPYGTFYLEAMDSHGAWVASAEDLVRFCAAFDDPDACKVLKPETVRTMFARPAGILGNTAEGKPKPAYYACGWMVRPVGNQGKFNAWHNGALPGTSTLMVHRADGLCWTVLFNARFTDDGKEVSALIDGLLHKAADAVKSWPN